MKYLDRIRKNKFFPVVLFVLVLVTFWYVNGSRKSRLLNKHSLVTVGEVTEADNNIVVYKYYVDGQEFINSYSFSPSKHIRREVGEKIYVRFSPKDPGSVSYAPFRDKKIEITLRQNEFIDSLNTKHLNWWWFD